MNRFTNLIFTDQNKKKKIIILNVGGMLSNVHKYIIKFINELMYNIK